MADQIIMPKLGFDMAEGTLINWTIAVGDVVGKGDVVAEIETDKATIEIESTVSGTVLKLLADPGDVVAVGTAIGYVGEEGESVPGNGAKPVAQPEAEEAGAQQEPAARPMPAAQPQPAAQRQAASQTADSELPGGIKASPIARRLAEEKGIDLRRIAGSGPGGRVVKKDVEDFPAEEAAAAPVPVQLPPAVSPEVPRPTMPTFTELPSGPDVEIIDLSRIRARIGQRLVESKQFVPHFYVTTEVDMAAALALRKQLNETIEDPAGKISVNDLVVKAAALALRQFPNLNTHYYGDKLARHKRINIGIAVALPDGLINLTAYDADKMALGTMARQNRDMIQRARDGKIKPKEIEGSTFSVSNLGPFDVEHFTAIINPPEAGIIAVGSAKKVPVVLDDGTLGVSFRMKATISVDHRVSDGAEAAEYMQLFKALLESPMRLLI